MRPITASRFCRTTPQREAVLVELLGRRVEHAVELEHGDRVLELEAAGDHREPLAHGRLGVLRDLDEVVDLSGALQLLGEGVELAERVALRACEGLRRALRLRPGDVGDAADLRPDQRRLGDDHLHADHVGEHGVLLAAEDVVDLRVDDGEVVADLDHRLLHGVLGHDPGGAGEDRRVGQVRARAPCEFDDALDLVAVHDHAAIEAGQRPLHGGVLLEERRRLLRQLHPSPVVLGDDRSRLHRGRRHTGDGLQPLEPEVPPRRQAVRREEALHCGRLADDGQAVAVADQLDVVIHGVSFGWAGLPGRVRPELPTAAIARVAPDRGTRGRAGRRATGLGPGIRRPTRARLAG